MPRYTRICIDKLYSLFEEYADNEDLTIAQIALREKIDVTTLKRLFNRIANYGNLETRSPNGVLPQPQATTELINQIVYLRSCGYSFQKIGDRVGFSSTHVSRLYYRRIFLLEKYEIKHKEGVPTVNIDSKYHELLYEEKMSNTKKEKYGLQK